MAICDVLRDVYTEKALAAAGVSLRVVFLCRPCDYQWMSRSLQDSRCGLCGRATVRQMGVSLDDPLKVPDKLNLGIPHTLHALVGLG